MEKLLTVVIPSYNVEKYLSQTLESFVIEKEWMEKVEILIVDDGSKDNTASIGKVYEEKYPGIYRVISKENGGHGSTINRGILEGKGRYFKVVDGDDWVDSKGFKNFLEDLDKCDSDFVITDYYEVNDKTKEKKPIVFSQIPYNKILKLEEVIERIQIPMHALTIKTKLLQNNNIKLDEHRFYVDVEYVLYPIPYVKDVTYFQEYVYMYRLAVATQSVSMAGYQKHMQDHIDVVLNLAKYLAFYMKKEENQNANKERIAYMCTRIAQMARDQINIFMSYPIKKEGIREKFIEFDKALSKVNPQVYLQTGTYSGMLRLLRKLKYRGYFLIMYMSKKKNK